MSASLCTHICQAQSVLGASNWWTYFGLLLSVSCVGYEDRISLRWTNPSVAYSFFTYGGIDVTDFKECLSTYVRVALWLVAFRMQIEDDAAEEDAVDSEQPPLARFQPA